MDREPSRLPVLLLAVIIAGSLGYALGQLALGVVGMLVIASSTAEYWLGTAFELTPEHVKAKTGLSETVIAWSEVKRVQTNGDVIRVSPLPESTRLEQFRGVLLRPTAENRDHVIECLRNNCNANVRFVGF